MKKLYKGKGKKIHPSPTTSTIDILSALPATILILAAALSPGEKEVLAYLLSAGQQKAVKKNSNAVHPPQLGCVCFDCYTSYWARWDASPNRHLIHGILDKVEESVEPLSLSSGKREVNRRKDVKKEEEFVVAEEEGKDEVEEEEATEGGSASNTVRRIMSYVKERVWGVWK